MQRLIRWLRQRRYRDGRVFTFWPAKDYRRDIQVCDTSRIEEDIVGVRCRSFGVLGRTGDFPEFGKLEYLRISEISQKGREF
ncbi:hypothetical protein QQ056_17040 [Oscillatoria laete-virens NRMC-F 0139]|nr:hypothetical protein [Oscillatoria laete-virens]MDL5055239.1 hypothetical protein [Oscillatoria laete-virens NRMC-F 0139]